MTEVAVDTKKHIYLPPIVEQVKTRAQQLLDLTPKSPKTPDDQWIYPEQHHLRNRLNGFAFYAGSGVSDLKRGLERVDSEALAQPLRSRFNRFNQDLYYLTFIEKGDLSTFNGLLSVELYDLKVSGDEAQMRTLNDILSRAIYLIPHMVKGVEVQLDLEKISTKNSDVRLFKKLESFLVEDLSSIILPLPHLPIRADYLTCDQQTLDLDHSGNQTVWFTEFNKPDKGVAPVLAIQMAKERNHNRYSFFPLEAVSSVKLLEKDNLGFDGDFTPQLELFRDSLVPTERPNYISHYLNFRLFNKPAYLPPSIPSMFEDDRENTVSRFLLTPLNSTNLTEVNQKGLFGSHPVLKRGFLAINADRARDVLMYELSDIDLPLNRQLFEVAGEKLIKIFEGTDKKFLGHVKRYTADDILRRLAAIPVLRG